MIFHNIKPERVAPYGYKWTDQGLVPDLYQSKVVTLIFSLAGAGVTSDEIYYLLRKYKVSKLTEERELDFEQLRREMLELIQAWRIESGARPIEMN
ncbi:hypothetical protein SDC9_46463 [bioreactor metagenome]|uniref:Uncharacterized protein n=2 Tax=root TaxID=1 RepID=A0A644W8Y5_9ZZZZ